MKLSKNKLQAFNWLSLSEEKRYPPTRVELAKELSITTRTLKNWEGELPEYKQGEDSINEVQEVLNNLLALSKNNAFAGKVFLQAKGELVEKSEHKVQVGFTSAEYIEVARDVLRRIEEIIPERCRGSCPLFSQPSLLLR